MDQWTTGCIFTTDTGRHARAGRKTSKNRDCQQIYTYLYHCKSHNSFGVRIADVLAGDPADGESFCLGFSHGCGPHEAILGPTGNIRESDCMDLRSREVVPRT